jgi:general secretion pathway protein A
MQPTPFSVSPNPLTLYITDALEAVLFKVRFTVNRRQGLTILLGDNGLGKSTVVRYLHAEFDARDDVISMLVPTPDYSSEFAMLQALCINVGLPKRRSILAHQEELQQWLVTQYAEGRNVVWFIDEAQKLTHKMLEVVRTLLNYETGEEKLIQIVLAGQLELREKLLSDKQKALKSRLMPSSVLGTLTLAEMAAMLESRCKAGKIKNPFTPEVLERLYIVSQGIPRAVLRLCAFAYDLMLANKQQTVTVDLIGIAEHSVSLED